MFSQDQTLQDLLPNVPENWKQDGPAQVYSPENLYDYIDGGAELYISYNFSSVISTRFIHPEYGEIRVEIFDMVEPRNAFGVFSHTRTKNQMEFGDGSQYFTGAQVFWKYRYFVTVIADDENEAIRTTIKSISKQIDERIKSHGQRPSVVEKLPTMGLAEDGFIYFHHYIWLNAFYFISNENILNINDQTNAVIAKYGEPAHRMYLLLIEYKSPLLASEAINLFASKYIKTKSEENLIRLEDGTWVGYNTTNNYFIAVFNGESMKETKDLIEKTTLNIR
jgi:hypothetical protein